MRYAIHRRAWRPAVLSALPLLLAALPAWAQADTPWAGSTSVGNLQQFVDQFLIDKRIPGAAVSIRQGGQEILLNAGKADVATGAAPGPDTYFGYRSVTKSLVGTVILQLAQEGRLKLDDPVSHYVSGVPSGDVITVRELAEMRSGLFSYTASSAFGQALVANPARVWTPQELLAYGFAEPLQFTPGTAYEYSNTNTILLGQIITAVTGSPWSEEVQRRLTGPLGLSSVVDPGANPLPSPNAVGYMDDGSGPESLSDFNSTGLGAAGALSGVIGDLARWGKAVGTGATLSEAEFVARLKSFGSTKDDPHSPEYDSYGFGMGEISGWIGHTGNGLGFEALVMYDRANDRTITILLNASNLDDADAPAHLFQELLALLGWTPPSNQLQVVADGTSQTVAAGPVWTGLVSGPFGARAAVYATNGGVVVANGPVTLAPMQDYVPAIYVARNGRVALDQGGTITASVGGDGAFLRGDGGTASLSLTGLFISLRGDAVTGTGVDVREGGMATLNGVQITGSAQAALHAGGTGPARITASGVGIDLVSGHGAWATTDGTIALSGSQILLRGDGVGLLASAGDGPAFITAQDVSVTTLGIASPGAMVQGAGASLALSGTQIATFGPFSYGAVLSGGAISLANSSITANGLGAAVVAVMPFDPAQAPQLSSLSLDGSALAAASGIAVFASGANLALSASGSQIGGAIMGANATVDLSLDNGSTWTVGPVGVSPPSVLSSIVNRNSGIVFAPPVIPGSYQSVTVGSYAGAGATLAMNAFLGGAGPSDRLVIDGGTATGQTQIIVRPTGGGAPTIGDGIMLVEARNNASTDPGAFSLNGGRVSAGAYDYNLYRGGAAGANDWFLRSSRPSAGGVSVPDLRPEVAVDLALPSMAARFGLAMLGTYDERLNARSLVAGTSEAGSAGWARALGEVGHSGSSGGGELGQLQRFASQGPSYDFRFAGFQAGLDLYRSDGNPTPRDVAGLFVGAGHLDGDVDAIYGGRAGQASMDAYTVGGYWTHTDAAGWYLDAAAQGTFYDQMRANSLLGELLKTSGWGFAASLEGGLPIALGSQWTIEPQAQVIYQQLSLDSGADRYGAVTFGSGGTAYGRIGARLSRDWSMLDGRTINGWARVSLWHAFGDGASATFATLSGAYPVVFQPGAGGTWAQIGAGVSAPLAANANLFASADYDVGLGDQKGHSVGGRLGFQLTW
ncbi:serine hydrolase [Chelatococcus sp. GCM10030263]|uniref:serine hydrolase n=1 Tax=Chelatococcus sp. GCM10030263 TaxID=3273387 RepID=UPI00360C8A9E